MAGPSSSTHSSPQRDNRESNALRASVLDAALELGLANNGTVAKWMFSNAIDEEEEEEEYPSPSLTYGSTSEDSPAHTSVEHSQSIDQLLKDNFSSFPPLDPAVPHSASGVMIPPISSTPEGYTPPEKGPKKLLKKKGTFGFSIDNGYESEGGYMSEGGKKTKKKKKEKASDDLSIEKKRLKEEKKDEKQREKEAKKAAKKEAGYETDGSPAISLPKRTKTKKQKDASQNGYETDDGYLSSTSKKKNKFFRLGNRSKGDLNDPVPPLPQQPVPALPPMPLPIAEQFATTLAGGNKSPPQESTTTASLRSNTLESSVEGGYVPGSEDSNHNNQFFGGVPLARTFSPDSTDSHPNGSPSAPTQSKRAAMVRFRDTALTIPDTTRPISPNIITPTSAQAPFSQPSSSSRSLSPIPPSVPRSVSPVPPASRPVSPYQSHPYAQRVHDLDARHIPTPLTLPTGLSTNTMLASPNRSASPLPVSPRPAPAGADGLMFPSNSYRQGRLQSGRNAPSPLEILAASELNVSSSSSNSSTSPLAPPSRTRLASYDTPPPSPPPDAPLPNVPGSLQIMQQQQQQPRALSPSPSPGGPQQRGKIAPFPTKPRTRPSEAPPAAGIEAKIRVRRYRDVFGLPSTPTGGWQTKDPPSPVEREVPQHRQQNSYDEAPGIQVLEPSDDEGDGQEILGVIQRWRYDEAAEVGGPNGNPRFKESAVGRRRSVDIVQNIRINSSTMIRDAPDAPESVYADEDDDRSLYPDDDQTAGRLTMYSIENGGGNTQSVRWSSVSADNVDEYSRRSLIDGAKSQRMRDAFVRRVEATFDESGREIAPRVQRNPAGADASNLNPRKREAVPPVPKIPEGWF